MIYIKSKYEIEKMRVAGKILVEAFEIIEDMIKPGVATREIDRAVERHILNNGATPSFKGYPGMDGAKDFPASICASINDEVIHGIPGDRVLNDGDILSVDMGAYKDGFHADAARTYPIGDVDSEALRLIEVTKESFFQGIEQAVEGNRIIDIGSAIEKYVEDNGFSVVKEFTGHGIGKNLHEDPSIPNYATSMRGVRLKKGMTLAIEPMVNEGTEKIYVLSDGWTIITRDKKYSAHYENTIAITDGEPEILTI